MLIRLTCPSLQVVILANIIQLFWKGSNIKKALARGLWYWQISIMITLIRSDTLDEYTHFYYSSKEPHYHANKYSGSDINLCQVLGLWRER